MIDRIDFADALVTFARFRKSSPLGKRIEASRVKDLSSESSYGWRDSERDEREALAGLEPGAALAYLGLVAKHIGEDTAVKLACDINRINRIDGVEIILETSDYDPFQTTAHIHDELASEWCDAHGSLDGGTWEECDGPEFCYDIINWYPGQIDALQKEGYDFNFSQYVEPDDEQIAVGNHLANCDECDYDYSKGEEHARKISEEPLFYREVTP